MSGARIQERRQAIELLLDDMPSNLVEARRYITEQTSVEPEPRILQCMVKIAGDPAEDGPRREIPRALLALRTVADDHLAMINGDDTASPETVMAAAGVLRTLEEDLGRIEQDMATALPRLANGDRAYLNELHQQLAPSKEKMVTAQMLARFFNLPEQPALPGDGGPPARDGAILLHLIGLDLAAWLTARTSGDGKPEPQDRLLGRLWLNLRYDRTAYKLISEGLADRKDTAFIQGSRQEYENLNRLQRSLFSAYSRLSRVLAAGKDGQNGDAAAASEIDLNASIAEAESAATALNESKEQRREVMDDALRGIRQSRTTPPKLMSYLEKDERDRKRRLRILGVTTGVLAVAAVVVNLMLMPPSGPAVDLAPREFSSAMPLKQTTSAAEVMLAETSFSLWTMWHPAERQQHVRGLIRLADQKGFSSLWLTDETGRPLAFWQQGSELKLF